MATYTVIAYNPKNLDTGGQRSVAVTYQTSWIVTASDPDEAVAAGGGNTSPLIVVLEHVDGGMEVAAHYENRSRFERLLVRQY